MLGLRPDWQGCVLKSLWDLKLGGRVSDPVTVAAATTVNVAIEFYVRLPSSGRDGVVPRPCRRDRASP